MFVSFLEEDIQVNILILYCVTVKWINNKYFGTYPQEKTSSHSESVSDSLVKRITDSTEDSDSVSDSESC